MNVLIVHENGNDWHALYIDDNLVLQGRHLDPLDILRAVGTVQDRGRPFLSSFDILEETVDLNEDELFPAKLSDLFVVAE